MIVHSPRMLTLSCAMLVSTVATAEDGSASRVEVVVRTSSGSGDSTERGYKKVMRDGVVIEEHGDPRIRTNEDGSVIDGADLARSVDAKLREMMEQLMREARAGKPADDGSRESKSSSSSSESAKSSSSSSSSSSDSSSSRGRSSDSGAERRKSNGGTSRPGARPGAKPERDTRGDVGRRSPPPRGKSPAPRSSPPTSPPKRN